MTIECMESGCKASIMGLDDLPVESVLKVRPDWVWTAWGWTCPAHLGASTQRSATTSADVERAATLAWNEALEAAATAMGDERTLIYGSEAGMRIRALKRKP